MATYSAPVFHAIADPTRRRLLDELSRGARPAGSLARKFPSSRPAIAKHLRVLREARLVRVRRQGRNQIYELAPRPLRAVRNWIERYEVFWSDRLEELARFVEKAEEAEKGRKAT